MPGTTRIALRDKFREVMAGVATPVSIVTTMSADGVVSGATVSAFSSLSMTPVMVMVALDVRSRTLELIRLSQRFGLNILGADQAGTALSFASRDSTDKFRNTPWRVDHGVPRIENAPGWIAATVAGLVDGGDHVIVTGSVVEAALTGTTPPLVYHRRSFGTHLPHREPR